MKPLGLEYSTRNETFRPAVRAMGSLVNSPPSPLPLVDQELLVDPDADAALGLAVEAVLLGVAGFDHAGPADRALGADGGVGGGVGVVVGVDVGVEAGQVEVLELAVGEVLGLEAGRVGLEDALEGGAVVGAGGLDGDLLGGGGVGGGGGGVEVVGGDDLAGGGGGLPGEGGAGFAGAVVVLDDQVVLAVLLEDDVGGDVGAGGVLPVVDDELGRRSRRGSRRRCWRSGCSASACSARSWPLQRTLNRGPTGRGWGGGRFASRRSRAGGRCG